ncbi:protein lin-28, partial [Paragonimus westermani]
VLMLGDSQPSRAPLRSTEFGAGLGERRVHTGRIKWFSTIRRFGFIVVDQTGQEIFFHQSNVCGYFYQQLTPNTPVSFMICFRSKGPEAYNIQPLATTSQPTYTGPITPRREFFRSCMHIAERTVMASEWALSGGSREQRLLRRTRPDLRPIRRFRCYNCGQYASHKAAFCPLEPMRGCCYLCRSPSHLLADCPLKSEYFSLQYYPRTAP